MGETRGFTSRVRITRPLKNMLHLFDLCVKGFEPLRYAHLQYFNHFHISYSPDVFHGVK